MTVLLKRILPILLTNILSKQTRTFHIEHHKMASVDVAQKSSNGQRPHFVLVPLFAPGHIIPMVDMARLLADHGAAVTVVTTPSNAARLRPVIDRVAESGLPIRFVPLRFPCVEAGLPEGCENLDAVPSSRLLSNFIQACAMLREPLLSHLRREAHPPDCIVADAGHAWTDKVARELGVTRIAFNGFGSFALLCRHILHYEKILESVRDDDETFVVPGLPHRIEMTRSHSPANFTGPGMDEFRDEMMDVELAADGVVVNSFDDLEESYVGCLQEARGMRVWTIGPVSMYNKDVADMAFRGNEASICETRCLSWLDSMRPDSVIYVSFGSLARTSPSQLVEIGLGLEASNSPFVWVIKAGGRSPEVEQWLSEGFEERIKTRGLVVRGWAPQLVILAHPAVGGFMTHCGWNSTIESVSAGVPMVTWPHFAEQFLNEKLVVEVLRVGIAVGVKAPVKWGAEHEAASVAKERVKERICRLMGGGEEGRGVRERVRELQGKAKRAMEKGGSSYENMRCLVERITGGMRREKEQIASDM